MKNITTNKAAFALLVSLAYNLYLKVNIVKHIGILRLLIFYEAQNYAT